MSQAWALPSVREGHAADSDLLARRERAAGTVPPGVAIEESTLGGSRCLLVEPTGKTAQGDILYLHGGGYRLGSPLGYIAYAQALADQSGRRVVLPFYALAPEEPFPAALNVISQVYRALPNPGETVIAGDSAGGGLAAALCILATRAGQQPAGAIMVSPMLDLMARSDSLERNATRDPLFSKNAVLDCARLYLQGHPPDDPLVSALEADPVDFPPLLVLTGSAEVLLDEALAFVRKLALADRRVSLHVAPGMGHVWPLMAPASSAAHEAIAAMAAFAGGLNRADRDGSA